MTRPVVFQTPRSGRPIPFNPSANVTATVVHDYELDMSSAVWLINGTPVFAPPPTMTNQPNPLPQSYGGPYTTTFTMTYAQIGIGATGPVVARFSVQEFPFDGSANRPPTPTIVPVVGVNEVRF